MTEITSTITIFFVMSFDCKDKAAGINSEFVVTTK